MLHLGGHQRIQRGGLDRHQQPERRVEGAGVALRPGSREQTLGTASGFGREHRRAFEESGRGGEAAARLRARRRALELLGHVLVGAGGCLRPVPGAAVGINFRIGDLRKSAVNILSLLN